MRILQICNFSSGISGVWTRVLEDSLEFLSRGHEVYVVSSDITEQGIEVPEKEEDLRGIKIKRFSVKKKIGYAVWFNFEDEALKIQPDIIICHGLRKPYLGPAIDMARLVKAKCFLVTHAPFIEKSLRSTFLNHAIKIYDSFMGKNIMNSFDNVIAICKWEKEELLKRGCEEQRIVYIPNSLSDDFFEREKGHEEKKILYMGRMHPVKEIGMLINVFKESNLKDYNLEIVSSLEGNYYNKIFAQKEDNIIFTPAIYDISMKIDKIDSAEIFVLPSKKESLPFGLIEAMARGKIVIATRTKGALELIRDKENGFLFDIGDGWELINLLGEIRNMDKDILNHIRENAVETAKDFRVSIIMDKWEELFK